MDEEIGRTFGTQMLMRRKAEQYAEALKAAQTAAVRDSGLEHLRQLHEEALALDARDGEERGGLGHLRRLVKQHDVEAQAVEARQPGGGARAADDGVARNGARALAHAASVDLLDGRLQRTPLAGRGRRQPHLALQLRSRPLLVVRRQLAVRRVGEHSGGDAL